MDWWAVGISFGPPQSQRTPQAALIANQVRRRAQNENTMGFSSNTNTVDDCIDKILALARTSSAAAWFEEREQGFSGAITEAKTQEERYAAILKHVDHRQKAPVIPIPLADWKALQEAVILDPDGMEWVLDLPNSYLVYGVCGEGWCISTHPYPSAYCASV